MGHAPILQVKVWPPLRPESALAVNAHVRRVPGHSRWEVVATGGRRRKSVGHREAQNECCRSRFHCGQKAEGWWWRAPGLKV